MVPEIHDQAKKKCPLINYLISRVMLYWGFYVKRFGGKIEEEDAD